MAHPFQKHRDASHTRVKQVLKADGGPVPTDAEMGRAKETIRALRMLGTGTWSGKNAFQYGAEDAQRASDRMRSS